MVIDNTRLQEFIGKAVNEWGAAEGALITFIGDRLGLFKAMAGAGELTPEELAKKTNTNERYIREWLANQVAGGYVIYNSSDGKYTLPPEQAMALADDNSPVYIHGAYQAIRSYFKDEDKFVEMFKTGK